MRYTQQLGKTKMSMKVGLTFACMNMKKLANLLNFRGSLMPIQGLETHLFTYRFQIVVYIIEKTHGFNS